MDVLVSVEVIQEFV